MVFNGRHHFFAGLTSCGSREGRKNAIPTGPWQPLQEFPVDIFKSPANLPISKLVLQKTGIGQVGIQGRIDHEGRNAEFPSPGFENLTKEGPL